MLARPAKQFKKKPRIERGQGKGKELTILLSRKNALPNEYQKHLEKLAKDRAGVIAELNVHMRTLGVGIDELVKLGLPSLASILDDVEFVCMAAEVYQTISDIYTTMDNLLHKMKNPR